MVLKRKCKSIVSLVETNLFRNGKRMGAEKTVYSVLTNSKYSAGKVKDVFSLIVDVFKNINPSIKISSKKVGGSVYRIPLFLALQKRDPLCAKWLVRSSCDRKMGQRKKQLLKEFSSALVNEGFAAQKKRSLQATAVLNRAYIKYM